MFWPLRSQFSLIKVITKGPWSVLAMQSQTINPEIVRIHAWKTSSMVIFIVNIHCECLALFLRLFYLLLLCSLVSSNKVTFGLQATGRKISFEMKITRLKVLTFLLKQSSAIYRLCFSLQRITKSGPCLGQPCR